VLRRTKIREMVKAAKGEAAAPAKPASK
jgi:hypothetical protein